MREFWFRRMADNGRNGVLTQITLWGMGSRREASLWEMAYGPAFFFWAQVRLHTIRTSSDAVKFSRNNE